MNVGIGTVAAQFLSWDYLFQIFGIVSLQCAHKKMSIFFFQKTHLPIPIYSLLQAVNECGPYILALQK